MPEPQTTARAESADAEAQKKLAEDVEKNDLMRELAILASRADAIEELQNDRKARLEGLMAARGERERVTEYGEASHGTRRSVAVVNEIEVAKRFSKAVLAEHFKPGVNFIEACKKTNIDVAGALAVGNTPVFSFERARTRKAKEQQRQLIEATKIETEKQIAAIVKSLKTKNKED